MKSYRFLLFFFLIAFIGQLGVTYSVNKKLSIEWSDADNDANDTEDDSNDSEGNEEECDYTASVYLALNCVIDSWQPTVVNYSNWKLLSFKQTDLLFSIDYPPEIS